MNTPHVKSALLLLVLCLVVSCNYLSLGRATLDDKMVLPFLKNTPSECYYLDDFMPVPDALVSGKTGGLNLRYYTYNYATYKDWSEKHIILSFYSRDSHCWSLFEEYYVAR